MTEDLRPPYRIQFDNARDPYSARNALGIAATTGGPPAPANAQYITAAADATLTAERVATDTATVTWDFATAGQAKANVVAGSFGDVFKAGVNVFTNTNTFQGGGTTVQGTTGTLSSFTMTNFQAANGNPNLIIQHSRGTTLGTHAAVIAADRLGQISFQGSDGAAFALGAIIQAFSEAVPTSGHVATNIRFSTDNGTAAAERVRIWASGGVDFDQSAAADPGVGNIKVKGIKARTDGVAVPTGYIGEYLEQAISVSGLTSATWVTAGSMSLSAGDWDVWAQGAFASMSATQFFYISISEIAASPDTTSITGSISDSSGNGYSGVVPTRKNFSGASKTIYLTTYATGSYSVTATIRARRRS